MPHMLHFRGTVWGSQHRTSSVQPSVTRRSVCCHLSRREAVQCSISLHFLGNILPSWGIEGRLCRQPAAGAITCSKQKEVAMQKLLTCEMRLELPKGMA